MKKKLNKKQLISRPLLEVISSNTFRDEKGRFKAGESQQEFKEETGRQAGRPEEYYPEVNQEIYDWFNREPYRWEVVEFETTTEETKYGPKTKERAKRQLIPCYLPTVERFCLEKKIGLSTFYAWIEKHAELQETVRQCHKIKMDILGQNALAKLYDGGFSKFLAVNISEMRDKKADDEEQDQTKKIDLSKLSDEELESMRNIQLKLKANESE